MSIKNPQQDLYETIQFVREGKEEDSENPFAKKGKKGKNPFAKKGDDEDDEDDDAEDDDEGKENPFAKKGKKSKKGKKDDDKEEVDEVAAIAGKIAVGAASHVVGKIASKALEARKRKKAAQPKTESFDDDNAIIEEIKNRVLAVLDERNKE